MALQPPPPVTKLASLPRRRLGPKRLFRIYLRTRASPWWFASAPGSGTDPGGRFDLPVPDGACYLGDTADAAVVETFQHISRGALPTSELTKRSLAEVTPSPGAPAAADLTSRSALGEGVTAGLWADGRRRLTQRWARALRRAGWLALFHGVQHDPSGRLRAVTLFDSAGEHLPYDDSRWEHMAVPLDPRDIGPILARFGIELVGADHAPLVVPLEESGLIDD